MAKKKKTGLGTDAFFEPVASQPASKPARHQSITKEDKAKVTFYLSKRIINLLEDTWIDLRAMADREQRKQINKSTIVNAALEIVLMDHQKRGKESELFYRTVRRFQD